MKELLKTGAFVAAAAVLTTVAVYTEPERRTAAIFSETGTTFFPDYKRPQYPTPPAFRGQEGPEAAPSIADLGWWRVFEDETLQLILETLSAHAFFFFLDDLGSGDHTVTVQSRISTGVYAEQGSANARAWVGKGSVSVEEVRLAKGVTINL